MKHFVFLIFLSLIGSGCAHSPKADSQKSAVPGANAIHQMAGCYLVDYSYVETEILKPGYKRDARVYDVNKDKSIKEWIYADQISPRRIRLQHILFATSADGKIVEGSELKHQTEDWEYEAPFMYEYVGASKWQPKMLESMPATWVRRVTNLDDGLRYQCAASWKMNVEYPEWTCSNYAPIPGRETRDMGRKDYNGLQRTTRIIVYQNSWLERQENTKTIEQGEKRTPLTKETGKNWYVRLPDGDCSSMKEFVDSRKEFWSVLRESWDEVYRDAKPFAEKSIKPPRFMKIMQIEEEFLKQNLKDPAAREKARKEILKAIEEYRETAVMTEKKVGVK